jgi:hypothetical protein
MFSVQTDTTQDITSKDQCSIIVRNVTDHIDEKLLIVLACKSSAGEHIFSVVVAGSEI